MISSLNELSEQAKTLSRKSRIALACAHDEHSIEALITARRDGIAESVLVGNADEIRKLLGKYQEDPERYKITDCRDPEKAIRICADYIRTGEADVLMKGKMQTADMMRGVLNRENGLRTERTLSVSAVFEVPAYHKMIGVSDVAIAPYPDLEAKKSILLNAVDLFHALGNKEPKVGILAAVENINPKMKETIEADQLKQMNVCGEIPGCMVEGPISFDLAVDREAAEIKGYRSQVAGDADILIAPDLICANVLAKCLTIFANASVAGIVLGAKIPIVLLSRSATVSDKYYSIAMAACTAPYFKKKYL